jgi:hypothetical protein
MVLDLNGPLSWRTAVDTVEMLDNLQAGILAPHARNHLRVLLLSFADPRSARTFLAGLVEEGLVKTARTHLAEIDAFREAQVPGGPHVSVALTQAGYALVAPWATPDDPGFGVPGAVKAHVLVAVADAVEPPVRSRLLQVRRLMPESTTEVANEVATPDGPPVDESARHADTAPLSDLLVRERGAADDENRFGSYVVYRKLHRGEEELLCFCVGARICPQPLPPGVTMSSAACGFLPSLAFLRSL